MVSRSPLPFARALDALRVRSLLPTTGRTADLAQVSADILERATFSARTNSSYYLSRIADVTDRLVGAPGSGRQIGKAKAAQTLREALRELGYHPGTHGPVPGSLQDFSSDRRIKVIIDTNTDQALGYGQHIAGQSPVLLDAFPAQELYRQRASRMERPWTSIWQDHGGTLHGGRMIALKNDPIWTAISRFNRPYPPFDFGSGMWVRDVSRKDALSLGVPGLETPIQPQTRNFNEDLAATPQTRHAALYQRLIADLQGIAQVDAQGTLRFTGSPA